MIPEAVLTGENKLASLGITSAPEKRNQAMPTSVPTAGEVFTMSQLFGLNLSMKINQIDGELITTETEFIYVINPITEDGAVVVTRFITEDKLKDFIDKSLMTTNIEPLVIYGKPVKFKRTVTLDIA
jgi:hypothetical protein